jgi:sarcosine oxidase/L-pipecolate oxidase
LSFTNNEPHLESGQIISCPPDSIAACIWRDDVPQLLKDEALKLVRGTYGPMTAGLEVESYRICWYFSHFCHSRTLFMLMPSYRDCITESQDWIISPHDFCSRLFIATGGSFHAWKFLPVLGSNIVDMMDGKLCADKANRWAWTPKHATEGGACDSYIPKRDMKDILAQEKVKSRV